MQAVVLVTMQKWPQAQVMSVFVILIDCSQRRR
jgi:hypothetical protein